MAKVSAIVLAAGLSRRMGDANKMGLLLNGKPIVHHVIDQLTRSKAFETIIVTSEISKDLFSNLAIILNEHYKTGMTTSIQAGIRTASEKADGFMICLGDQPLIKTSDYDQILDAFDENIKKDPRTIVLPTFDGKRGNPVIFSNHYKDAILRHQQPEGCKEIVQTNKGHIAFVEMGTSAILTDVDRPEDYEKLLNDSNQRFD